MNKEDEGMKERIAKWKEFYKFYEANKIEEDKYWLEHHANQQEDRRKFIEEHRKTVGDMIKELQKYPTDMLVMLPGYEGGFEEILQITEAEMCLDYYKDWYNGRHRPTDNFSSDEDEKNYTKIKAVLLNRDVSREYRRNKPKETL